MLGKQSTFTERKTSHSSAPKEGKTGSFFGWRTNNSAGSFFTPVSSPAVQPKLTINQPGDKYEQEADAMAEQVVQAESIQRQTNPEEEEMMQAKPLSEAAIQRQCAACEQEGQLQRQAAPEEEEMLQSKPLMRVAENGAATATPQLASQLNSSKGGGQPLPKGTLSSMNNVFGADFSGVRVHTGSRAQEMSQGIQAKSFTHGSDIYFNKGQYNPGSTEGKRLLAHELTHVVQQGNSRLIQAPIQRSSIKEANESSQDSNNSSRSGSMFTAPFRDGKPASSFKILVVVDQPVNGGDRDTYEGINVVSVDVGHTFIQLIKTNTDGSKVNQTFGFYPEEGVNPVLGPIEVQGKLENDAGHKSEIKASKSVSQEEFNAVLDYIDAHHKDQYNLNTYNCTDFALGAAAAGGFKLPDKQGTWPGGRGSNPGDLGEDIREIQNP